MQVRATHGFILAAAISALALVPAGAGAATITVTATTDDDPGTQSNNGVCTLREAIDEAAAIGGEGLYPDCDWNTTQAFGNDTITLNAGTYVLDEAGSAEDNNATGDLDVDNDANSGSLVIDGAGATLTTIDPVTGWADRVLHQPDGPNTLTVSDLTVTDGDFDGGGGGGILSENGGSPGSLVLQQVRVTSSEASQGGGVQAGGASLSITDSEISGNSTVGGSGGGVLSLGTATTIDSSLINNNSATDGAPSQGGGLQDSSDVLTITDSVISGNDATTNSPSSAEAGGAAVLSDTATIRSTEISGNSVNVIGGASSSIGGGIRTQATTLALVNSTLDDNHAEGSGSTGAGIVVNGGTTNILQSTVGPNPVAAGNDSALVRQGGTLNVRGSVIESSGGEDACGGTITSLGRNVFTDASCGTLATGDEAGADPMLGALADNGGPDAGAPGGLVPVKSMAPAVASTAIDHVPQASCLDAPSGFLTVDQRGFGRPFDTDGLGIAECEAGSLEVYACFGSSATSVGTAGADVINGTAGADVIHGADGGDTITGLGGADKVCGGAGDDELQLADGVADQGDCGPGTDSFLPDASLDTLVACETDLTPGRCAGKTATITGTSAGEVLKGTSSRDVIAAKGGKDTVKGLGGDDLLCGGDGNDKLIGATGKDTLRGDAGRDTLLGGAGKDKLKGGAKRDVCNGGAKRDSASGCERRRKI